MFLASLLVLILAAYICFRSAKVQTWLTQKIAAHLTEAIGTKVEVGGVDIDFFSNIIFENIYIEDLHHDTLLYASKLKSDINKIKLDSSFIDIDLIYFSDLLFKLKQYKDEPNLNLQFIIDYFRKDDTTQVSWNIKCDKLRFDNASFRYDDENIAKKLNGIDYNHLSANNINLYCSNLEVNGGNIVFVLDYLELIEHCGFELKRLQFEGEVNPTQIICKKLFLQTPYSHIRDYFSMRYESYNDFNNFIDNVYLGLQLRSSKVALKDISYFVPVMKDLQQNLTISGEIKGKVKNLNGKELLLKINNQSSFEGSIKLSGLPNIQETFIDLNVKQVITSKQGIESIPFTPHLDQKYIQLPQNIAALGNIVFSGRFTGFLNDFVANGDFNTSLGRFTSDINMKIDVNTNKTSYTGGIKTFSFNIGKLTGQDQYFGKVNLDAVIKGKGLRLEDITDTLTGTIHSIDINNYNYKNLNINATIGKKLFNGTLTVNDENLNLDFSGIIDFSGNLPAFDFVSNVKKAKLYKLNVIKADTSAILATKLNLKFTGNSIDNLQGSIDIYNTFYTVNYKTYQFDSLKLTSVIKPDNEKDLKITSDLLDVKVKGYFNADRLLISLQQVLKNYIPKTINLFAAAEADETTTPVSSKQIFDFDIVIHDIKAIHKIFDTELHPANKTTIYGFINSNTNQMFVSANSEKIFFMDDTLSNFNIVINSVDDSLAIKSSCSRFINKNITIENLQLSSTVFNDSLILNLKTGNLSSMCKTDINVFTTHTSDSALIVKFLHSQFYLSDSLWELNRINSILIKNKEIDIKNLALVHNTQEMLVNGVISDDQNKKLEINLNNFNLDVLNQIFSDIKNNHVDGIAFVNLSLSDLYNNPQINANFLIENLVYNSDTIGNTALNVNWDEQTNKVDLFGNIVNKDFQKLKLQGYYLPDKQTDNLNITILLPKTELAQFKNVLTDYVSDLEGIVSANIQVKGDIKNPSLAGLIKMENAGFTVDYLNTHYKFSDVITITKDKIVFDNIDITDVKNNNASISGYIDYGNFSQFNLNLVMNTKKFQYLNTTEAQNDLYYGTAYATGNVRFTGPISNLTIDIASKTEPNTEIYIPLYKSSELSSDNYITFVNKTKNEIKKEYVVDLSGLQLNFELEVTPDAQVQLIFDPQIGDIIKGRGISNLKMEINTLGYFNMFGTYIIDEGDYLFTYKNVINKRFKIQKGGTIQWTGDPYEAKINLNAIYKLRASLINLMQNFAVEGLLPPEEIEVYKKRVPVECYLTMTGSLFSPNVDFEINTTENIPDLAQIQLQALKNNEQEMNKQIFSLLALNQFTPPEEVVQTGSAVGTSARELLSNQISNWVSKYRDDLDIGINYQSKDSVYNDLTRQELQVALTKRFYNDRISINIDGNFELGENSSGTTNKPTGDFTLEWKPTKDGKIRLKTFHKTYNDLLGYNYSSKAGIGIFYKEEFDNFKELFRPIKFYTLKDYIKTKETPREN